MVLLLPQLPSAGSTYGDFAVEHPKAVTGHASRTASDDAILVAVERAVCSTPDSPLPVLTDVHLRTVTSSKLKTAGPWADSILCPDARPDSIRAFVRDEEGDRRGGIVPGDGDILCARTADKERK